MLCIAVCCCVCCCVCCFGVCLHVLLWCVCCVVGCESGPTCRSPKQQPAKHTAPPTHAPYSSLSPPSHLAQRQLRRRERLPDLQRRQVGVAAPRLVGVDVEPVALGDHEAFRGGLASWRWWVACSGGGGGGGGVLMLAVARGDHEALVVAVVGDDEGWLFCVFWVGLAVVAGLVRGVVAVGSCARRRHAETRQKGPTSPLIAHSPVARKPSPAMSTSTTVSRPTASLEQHARKWRTTSS